MAGGRKRRTKPMIKLSLFYDRFYAAPVGERSIAISLSVCSSVCVSVREHICGKAGPIFTKFCMQIPCAVARSSSGGVGCDTLCTSGLMDDVTFGRSGPYGNAWLAALRYRGGV